MLKSCFALGSRTFWKPYDGTQSVLGEMGVAIQKLDGCNGIDKQSSCSAAQQIDVLVTRPSLQPMPSCELGKFVFQEEPDVAVDQWGVNIVQNEDCGRLHEHGETKPGPDPWLGW